jgi:hypothetical protein
VRRHVECCDSWFGVNRAVGLVAILAHGWGRDLESPS